MSQSDLSVLLVDDDADVRGVFELVMNHHQVPLAVASDAESALEYLQNHDPSVIVLDIFLPGLDGYQALKQIRKNQLAPNSLVVAITAYYTADSEQDALSRGFDGYLTKPIKTTELVPYLEEIAAG